MFNSELHFTSGWTQTWMWTPSGKTDGVSWRSVPDASLWPPANTHHKYVCQCILPLKGFPQITLANEGLFCCVRKWLCGGCVPSSSWRAAWRTLRPPPCSSGCAASSGRCGDACAAAHGGSPVSGSWEPWFWASYLGRHRWEGDESLATICKPFLVLIQSNSILKKKKKH